MTLEKAREILLEDVNYFGTVMVAAGDADGMVSGAIHTTANTVRPALQIIKVSNQNCSGFTVYSLAFCLLSH
jgi:phosphotransacetylase